VKLSKRASQRRGFDPVISYSTSSLEKLHLALVALRRRQCSECSEISALSGVWIPLARIEAISAGFQFPNHVFRLQLIFAARTVYDPSALLIRQLGLHLPATFNPCSVIRDISFVRQVTNFKRVVLIVVLANRLRSLGFFPACRSVLKSCTPTPIVGT
jgi:hypothetical protein